jgi:hypothetical protein
VRSRGLGDVYKRQLKEFLGETFNEFKKFSEAK